MNRVSADLSRSLRRCHMMVDDYRAQLVAANSNDDPFMLSDTPPRKDREDR